MFMDIKFFKNKPPSPPNPVLCRLIFWWPLQFQHRIRHRSPAEKKQFRWNAIVVDGIGFRCDIWSLKIYFAIVLVVLRIDLIWFWCKNILIYTWSYSILIIITTCAAIVSVFSSVLRSPVSLLFSFLISSCNLFNLVRYSFWLSIGIRKPEHK